MHIAIFDQLQYRLPADQDQWRSAVEFHDDMREEFAADFDSPFADTENMSEGLRAIALSWLCKRNKQSQTDFIPRDMAIANGVLVLTCKLVNYHEPDSFMVIVFSSERLSQVTLVSNNMVMDAIGEVI